MSDIPPGEDKLGEEIRSLGKNLLGLFQTAWDHPERKRVQAEFEKGLRELSETLQKEADNFSNSPTGEKIKSEFEDIGARINSGEAKTRFYEDLISALKLANSELSGAIDRFGHYDETPPAPETEQDSGS